ncbi:hypothetical protein D3C87_1132380 [compost metagenome]
MEIGIDEAGAHGVDPNPLARHFLGQADGEGVQRAFGGRVVDVLVGRAQTCGHRGHVDDAAALPAVPGRHAQDRVLGTEDRRQDVGFHDFENAELGHLVDPGLLPDCAGVVHQRGDPTQFSVYPVEQCDDFVFDADVGPYCNGLRTEGADLLQHAECSLFVRLVVDADPIALRGGQQRGGGTNAAATAGDDDDFVHASFPPIKA